MPQLGVDAAFVVFDPGLPLAAALGVGAGLAPSSPTALITSFTWRAALFLSKALGNSIVPICWESGAACSDPRLLRPSASQFAPFFELLDQSLSVFPGGLDSDVITMDRSADSPRLFGV